MTRIEEELTKILSYFIPYVYRKENTFLESRGNDSVVRMYSSKEHYVLKKSQNKFGNL